VILSSGTNCEINNGEVPTLRDIGQGLGRIPRFAGHTDTWYPVLCHVLTVAESVHPKWSIYGLMHDAPEAVTSDTPTPWKTKEQSAVEHILYERICRAYGLPWPIPPEGQAAVAEADYRCLAIEAHVLGHRNPWACLREDHHPLEIDREITMATKARSAMAVDCIDRVIAADMFTAAFVKFSRLSIEAGLELRTHPCRL